MVSTGLVNNSDYLNWGQIKEMVNSGNIKVYNHTWSHHNLKFATNEKIELEIITAQEQLGEYAGTTPEIFAYPYGGYGKNVIDFLKTNGFVVSFSRAACRASEFMMVASIPI